jgi:NitT/TauT family transport system substrate-binding protein
MTDSKTLASIQLTRRAFLKYSIAGAVTPTILGMVPDPVSGQAYAQSEQKIAADWLEIASKYGSPTGKFGKIGDPVTLTIGYQPYGTIHWTATINKQAQLLEKYLPPGSKVVWFRSLSGPLISRNMFAGKNQFGYMSDTPALAVSDKVSCDLVANSGYDLGEFGSICVPNKLLEDGIVKIPKDLEGTTVATALGSFSHRQILTWMHANNVTLNLVGQSIDQQMTSLSIGAIHAAVLWEPYASWLEIKGVAKRWHTGQDMPNTDKQYGPEGLDTQFFRDTGSTLAIHDWLRERPDVMGAYLKAEEECRDMLNNNPDLAAYYIWTDISEVPQAAIRGSIDMVVWDGRLNADMIKHLKACARQWKAEGKLESPRSKDADAYVDEWADDKLLQLVMKDLESEGYWTSNRLPGFPKPAHPQQMQRQSWEKYQDVVLEPTEWVRTKV